MVALYASSWFAPNLHSTLEAFGSVAALVLAALCLLLSRFRPQFKQAVGIAIGLIAMGVLDGVHASVPPGPALIWTHSVAVLAGGVLLGVAWLWSPVGLVAAKAAPLLGGLLALGAGVAIALAPGFLPPPSTGTSFTMAPIAANLAGGAGFLFAAVSSLRHREGMRDVFPGFAIFAALQGLSGLLFPFSHVWDPSWWLWHGVRLAAYGSAIACVFSAYQADAARAEQLRQENEALKQVDALKDRFLAMLSHELRTPLNAVIGFGSLLEDEVGGPLTSLQQGYVRKMLSGANVLLVLIGDLLDMSRIQSGNFSLARRVIDVPEVLRGVLANLEPLARAADLGVSVMAPEDLPPILADEQRLAQVFYNLVGNAIKFTPPGGSILIRIFPEDGTIRCEVRDSGPGIAPEDLPKLFKPFSQLAPPGTSAKSGTGLGLAISKALVEAHQGQIGVESIPGQGSTFWFTLPVDTIPAESKAGIGT